MFYYKKDFPFIKEIEKQAFDLQTLAKNSEIPLDFSKVPALKQAFEAFQYSSISFHKLSELPVPESLNSIIFFLPLVLKGSPSYSINGTIFPIEYAQTYIFDGHAKQEVHAKKEEEALVCLIQAPKSAFPKVFGSLDTYKKLENENITNRSTQENLFNKEEERFYERVVAVICEVLGKEKEDITPESHINHDLGADSLDFVNLFMFFQDEFKIDAQLPFDDGFGNNLDKKEMEAIRTVKGTVEYLKKMVEENV